MVAGATQSHQPNLSRAFKMAAYRAAILLRRLILPVS